VLAELIALRDRLDGAVELIAELVEAGLIPRAALGAVGGLQERVGVCGPRCRRLANAARNAPGKL
jgi:hypothetical protein